MLRKFREIINPPYSTKDVLVISGVVLILVLIPLTVVAAQQARELVGRAKQTKEKQVTTPTQTLDQSYIPDQLVVQFKPGVDKPSKERIYKNYKLTKLPQAKGQEKYNVQLVKTDPKKAKQTIRALSKNKRIGKVDYVRVFNPPVITTETDTKVKGLATPAYAQTLHDSMTTPEGTKIEIYSTQVTAQEIYDVFKRNGLDAEVGKTLKLVKVQDDGYVYASMGTIGTSQGQIPFATIYLVASYLLQYPDLWVGHEYGHVFGWHYKWTVWNGSWSAYHDARGLTGDPRLESSYSWSTDEIFAEDYRQLLAAPEAWTDAPYQGNWNIPLATEVPGLQDFLCTTFQGKTSNSWHRCTTSGDNQAPVVSITSPSNGATASGLMDVRVSASDNVGVTKVNLYVDGNLLATDLTSPYVFSWDTTQETNGNHTLTAKAYDAAGNLKTSSTVTVTVSNTTSDTEPPVVSLTSPTEGQTVSGTITASATATDNVGVTRTDLYVDNNLKGTDTSSPYSFNLDTKTLSNGNHNLEVRARDGAGNTGYSGIVTVNVNNGVSDTQPPTVKMTSPTDGATISKKSVKIKVSASDNVGVTKVQIYIDGALKKTFTDTSRYQYNWNTRKYLSGTHLITAKAYDAAGNSSSTSISLVKK